MKILHLTLHRKWFDAIATGAKLEEYREAKPFWGKRFFQEFGASPRVARRYDEIHFRNGYAKNAPWMRVEWKGIQDGTFEGEFVWAIQLGKVLEIKNWKAP